MADTALVSLTPFAEKQILYCARVSSDQLNDSPKLLKYLIDHKHWSPFEMAHAVFEIKTSRAIAAQILRHRSFSFQEFSQRYARVKGAALCYRARRAAETNRQSSVDDLPSTVIDWFYRAQEEVDDLAHDMYEEALERGIATEQARFLLPLNTPTTLYMSGTLRSWIHYFDLRCDEHTQKEHQDIALEIRERLASDLPNIAEALGWNNDS